LLAVVEGDLMLAALAALVDCLLDFLVLLLALSCLLLWVLVEVAHQAVKVDLVEIQF
jgi:hypothetical protein